MDFAESFRLPFNISTGMVLTMSCICLWILKIKFQKYHNGSENSADEGQFENVSLWKLLKFCISLLKWHRDKSEIPFIQEMCLQLNKVSPSGKPKLFRIFGFKFVVNEDFESIANVFLNKQYSCKIPRSLSKILCNGKTDTGIIMNDGPTWKELRNYTIKKLSQLGFGKSDNLSLILTDLLPDLLNQIESVKNGTSNKIPVKDLFSLHVVNVIWCTIGGKKFLEGEEQFERLRNNINNLQKFPVLKGFLGSLFPETIRYLFGFEKVYDIIRNSAEYFEKFVQEKEQLMKEKQLPEDFVEYFLIEIEKHKYHEELRHVYSKGQLTAILVEFFVAGMDTTSKYLELFLMYMILNPEIQRKIQEEIDLVVPGNINPSYSDHKQRMPYTCAAMMEAHRMGNVLPLANRYVVSESYNHLGQSSKERLLITNVMWALRMNASYWGDPHEFRPQRFLNLDNTFNMEKMNRVMPFGAGPRVCPGDNVSTASSFTFLVAILKKYSVGKASCDEVVGIQKNYNVITQILPFHVALQERLL